MKLIDFHKALVGDDPTPAQVKVYQVLASRRGVFRNEPHKGEFIAVFVASLKATIHPHQKAPLPVYLILPDTLQTWANSTINAFLEGLRKVPIEGEAKKKRNKALVKAIKHLLIGTASSLSPSGPPSWNWLAYGFSETDSMPDWLKIGQASEPVDS